MKIISTFLIILIIMFWIVSAFGDNNSNLTPKEQLGKELFFDKLSDPDWMSCATCHAPDVGFTGPIPGINDKAVAAAIRASEVITSVNN